jgi:biotin carboxylase
MDAVERFLCLASHEKGHDFVRQCVRMGVRVTLLTLDAHREAAWPVEALEELTTMPAGLNREQILNTVSWMARGRRFDRVVALDEHDLETAAQIREHMRVPGMGTTTAGCYRDKLAQRVIAGAFGYKVPEFCRVLNYDELREYMARVQAPWLLRPRVGSAYSAGITIYDAERLWRALDDLGDAQSNYIFEEIVPGDVFYVDAIVSECEVKFSAVHQGGERRLSPEGMEEVFTSRTVDRESRDAKKLAAINMELAPSLGMVRGVTHSEFLRSHADGSYYFVEIGARVGGALLDQVVEAATGVNLWREWARLEICDLRRSGYAAPESYEGYAGSVVCAAQGPWPDLDSIADPSIVSRERKNGHAGLVFRGANAERVKRLVEDYRAQFEGSLVATGVFERVMSE